MALTLASCVSSLQSTNQLLSSSISILGSGVNDFPRLSKVLQTTRVSLLLIIVPIYPLLILMQHFELLPESSLQAAQRSLLDSLTPEIKSLLTRCESHLDRLERREQALIARCELLEGRLSSGGEDGRRSRSSSLSGAKARVSAGGDGGEGAEREMLKLKQMRAKKERLQYAVERLELQAKQKQRELRRSVAAQPGVDED